MLLLQVYLVNIEQWEEEETGRFSLGCDMQGKCGYVATFQRMFSKSDPRFPQFTHFYPFFPLKSGFVCLTKLFFS